MDDARLSRFPHHSWTQFLLQLPSGGKRLSIDAHGTTFVVSIALNGRRSASRITHGQQRGWSENSGMVSYVPADRDQHTYLMTSDSGCDLLNVLIPPSHLTTVTEAEGLKPVNEWTPVFGSQDAVMRDCMASLAATPTSQDVAGDVGIDEVARRLVLRLVELNGGGKPDWHDDASVFDRRTLFNLVAYLDEHLCIAPSLGDMALLVGVSPSHFAKKFRQSTGLSLNRFVNRRRILRSFETLRTDASLASIALDLGFSSQSHFTRLFSGLTGMTPAKYHKSVKRTMG
jgi:AraC family transcriptional regulator